MKLKASSYALAFFSTLVSARPSSNTTTNSTTSAQNLTSVGLLSSGKVNLDAEWEAAYQKAAALVATLDNTEKITIITGGSVAAKNWTALAFKDGTQGVEGFDYVTGFSEASALVFTWDKDLMTTQFTALAKEFYGKGIQITNAPTSEPLGRTPWSGRLVETLGQDAYLNGIAFGLGNKAFVAQGIIPGGKHFLLNEQETNRDTSGSLGTPYSAVADDKTLHETYMWPFYDGVKNGMGGVMCAMNKVNGSQSCESGELLLNLLKTEIGFPGMVFPDVGGQFTSFGSATGGLDYGSSQLWSDSILTAGISNGSFTQARLDDMVVRNIIGLYYVQSGFPGPQPATVGASAHVDVRANHSSIVRSNGAAAIVLLKNTNNALPLSKPLSIAMFGQNAGPIMAGPNVGFDVQGSGPTYAGHLAGGTGSGTTSFPYLITPQAALTQRASVDGTMMRWILNDTYTSTSSGMGGGGGGGFPGVKKRQGPGGGMGGGGGGGGGGGMGSSGTAISQTLTGYATGVEVCLVFMNALAGEGADRTELFNPEQDTLVTSVAADCNNTIVIVNTVGARLVDAWIENENVTAVLYSSLLGQESGNSIVDVLYGDVNPSGRLPYTIAKNESDYPVKICETAVCNFTEGNYIDYKWFDMKNITPRFEFGYGLSYTNFEYSDIAVTVTNQTALSSTYPTGVLSVGGATDLWDEVISVTVNVKNSGTVAGNEVTQLYLQYPDAADEPIRQLRGFERTSNLTAGASETVTYSIRRRDVSIWDVAAQKWAVVKGDYIFSAGGSSRSLPVNATITI